VLDSEHRIETGRLRQAHQTARAFRIGERDVAEVRASLCASISDGDIVIWDNLSTLHRGLPIERTENPQECRFLYRMNVEYV